MLSNKEKERPFKRPMYEEKRSQGEANANTSGYRNNKKSKTWSFGKQNIVISKTKHGHFESCMYAEEGFLVLHNSSTKSSDSNITPAQKVATLT